MRSVTISLLSSPKAGKLLIRVSTFTGLMMASPQAYENE
jgi:hypothetical protein